MSSRAHERVAAALGRLELLDPWLRAFVDVTADAALAAADRLDATRSGGGPLSGMPIAVKHGTRRRGLALQRLLAAGAIPIGTTSVPRGAGHQTWGHTDRGPTRNPWRADLSPGGSSAGSAAAVAAGIVDLATAADGAGSTRIPAAWCGIFGYKPTTGLTPSTDRAGLAVAGPLVRDPALLPVWAGAVLGALPPAAAPRTCAWSADLGFAADQLDDEVVAVARAAARRLAAVAGLEWREAPIVLSDPAPAWTTLRTPDALPAARDAALALRRDNDARLDAVLGEGARSGADLLLTPTTPGRPHGHDGPGDHMSVALTWALNLSGHPAISVPAGFTADGAPVGLQIVAAHRRDDALLRLVASCCPPAPVAPAGGRVWP